MKNPHTTNNINITRSWNQIPHIILIRALNSYYITDVQLGSDMASLGFLGRGEIINGNKKVKEFYGVLDTLHVTGGNGPSRWCGRGQ